MQVGVAAGIALHWVLGAVASLYIGDSSAHASLYVAVVRCPILVGPYYAL